MEVEVKAAGWRYRLKSTGKFTSPVERGAKVDLDLVMDDDVDKARRHGVFIEASAAGDDGAPADTSGAPFDQGIGPLSEWLREAKLNVDRTVRLAGGDATKARMLIDAEPAATSGKPRAGVLKALGQVIVRAEENGDTPDADATEPDSTSDEAGGSAGANDPDAAGDGHDDEEE